MRSVLLHSLATGAEVPVNLYQIRHLERIVVNGEDGVQVHLYDPPTDLPLQVSDTIQSILKLIERAAARAR
jgi:hypothetical protein